jgi:hypothetical protein
VHNVVDLVKKPLPKGKRPGRNLAPPKASHSRAARFFTALVNEIEHDLGGKRQLSRIESELVRAFSGAATQVQYYNFQLCALGDLSECDPQAYSTLASTMLRIGSRLGLQRRHQRVLEPDLKQYLELAGEELVQPVEPPQPLDAVDDDEAAQPDDDEATP